MKKLSHYLMPMLAAFVLLGGLCSCGDVTNDSVPTSDGGYVIDGTSIMKYEVVRSDYAEGDLVKCGMDVRSAFVDAGYDIRITTDFYREGNPNFTMGEFEVLVGETNRPETAEFLDGLQMWQYGYALVGEKIVIAGHDDSTTRLAVEAFREFLSERTPFTFSSADNYIHGDIKEGTGEVFSILTYDLSNGTESEADTQLAEYAPDLMILQNADDMTAERDVPSGYALGADYTLGETHTLVYYSTETYTYSSAGQLLMSQMPMLSDIEKGGFTYCVVRHAATKDKYVICASDLSAVDKDDVGERMKVFKSFSENSGELPILFVGFYDGSANGDTCELLTSYGYADVMRLATETEGESGEQYMYVPYNDIAPARAVSTENGIYAEYQRAK